MDEIANPTETIEYHMTWSAAAQIIAAALENGTGAGRDAARAELFRMASILDAMIEAKDATKEQTT